MTNTKRKFYLDGVRIPVHKTKQPKFSNKRGATWDCVEIVIDGKPTDVYLDTTWGECIYFLFDGEWKKCRMASTLKEEMSGKIYNIDPLSHPKPRIIVE